MSASAVTLTATPPAGCLAQDDEVLLINLQGTNSGVRRTDNVGNHDLLRVSSISGTTVSFQTAKTRSYGDTAGSDAFSGTSQRVFLQRVPNYTSVTVNGGATLTGNPWSTTGGGVLFFRASGTVRVDGMITMSGAGYAGGQTPVVSGSNGIQGESRAGRLMSYDSTFGGLGGGYGGRICNTMLALPGGGGALFGAGGVSANPDCPQNARRAYASFPLMLHLASGGGSGASAPVGSNRGGDGGRGGGVIVIHADQIQISGSVVALGTSGTAGVGCGSCQEASAGGGGGAGGTIVLGHRSGLSGAQLAAAQGGSGVTGCPACVESSGRGSDGAVFTP